MASLQNYLSCNDSPNDYYLFSIMLNILPCKKWLTRHGQSHMWLENLITLQIRDGSGIQKLGLWKCKLVFPTFFPQIFWYSGDFSFSYCSALTGRPETLENPQIGMPKINKIKRIHVQFTFYKSHFWANSSY